MLKLKFINYKIIWALIFIIILGLFTFLLVRTEPSFTGYITYTSVNNSCVNVTSPIVISKNTTLCASNISVNLSSDDILIDIINSDVLFDCNNSILQGNGQSGTIAINVRNGLSNISIKNCVIINFTHGIQINSYSNYTQVFNNTIMNTAHTGINAETSNNLRLYQNQLVNSNIYIHNGINGLIEKNRINCNDSNEGKCGSTRIDAIHVTESESSNISNNSINGAQLGIYLYSNNSFLNIINNNISGSDRGLLLADNVYSQINIVDNNFANNNANYDAYNLDIHIKNSSYLIINNNLFSQSTDNSLLLTESNQVNISDNLFNLICLINRSQYAGNGQNEPCSAILIKELYKSWCYGCDSPYSIDEIRERHSSNIYISNNEYNNESLLHVFSQGTENLTVMDNSIWYRTFNTSISGKMEFYVSNNHKELRNYIRNYHVTKINNLYEGYELIPHYFYGIKQTEIKLINEENLVLNLSFNLTQASPYNSIYNVTGGFLIAYNVSNYTLSLNPGEEIHVSNYTNSIIQSCTLENRSWYENDSIANAYNLSACFSDPLGQNLTYAASGNSSVIVTIQNGSVHLNNTEDWSGTETVTFRAAEGNRYAVTSPVALTVNPVYVCGDGTCDPNESCSTCAADCGTCSTPSGGGGGSSSPSTPPPVLSNVTINATTNETNLTKPEPEPEQTTQVTKEPEPKEELKEPEPEPEPEEDESIIEVKEQLEAKEPQDKESGALVGQALQKDESITWKGQRSIWISIGTMMIIAALTITTLILKTKAPKAKNQLDMLRLDKKIAQLQDKGLSQSDIKTRLILEGYKPSDIHLEHHVNYYLQLKNWIQDARRKGASDEKMSELLRGQGWQESVIREMLK